MTGVQIWADEEDIEKLWFHYGGQPGDTGHYTIQFNANGDNTNVY